MVLPLRIAGTRGHTPRGLHVALTYKCGSHECSFAQPFFAAVALPLKLCAIGIPSCRVTARWQLSASIPICLRGLRSSLWSASFPSAPWLAYSMSLQLGAAEAWRGTWCMSAAARPCGIASLQPSTWRCGKACCALPSGAVSGRCFAGFEQTWGKLSSASCARGWASILGAMLCAL